MTGDALTNIFTGIIILVFIILISLISHSIGRSWGYRDGQIDALTGSIYYKLERQENNEFIWVECPGICRYEKQDEE